MSAAYLAVLAVLVVGTVARLTRLVTADSITEPFRDWVNAKATKKLGRKVWTWFDDLINCPWCSSLWVGPAVAYVAVWFPTNRFVLGGMIACTASWLAANVQIREPE